MLTDERAGGEPLICVPSPFVWSSAPQDAADSALDFRRRDVLLQPAVVVLQQLRERL